VASEPAQDGDILVLCTDGLHQLVNEEELRSIVLHYEPQESAQKLIERANELGSPDNVTALVVRVTLSSSVSVNA
jgi:serine/threonine protein phosphatase PrpC